MNKPLTIADLNKIYTEAESADREVFAEQRSNILLVAGEHYSRRDRGAFERRIRTSQDLTEQQKLRLTKNHIHRAQRHYVTSILAHAPGVAITPRNDKELQDQKAAELNKAVWEWAKAKYRVKEKIREWCNDFITVGEVALKIFWDPNAGELVGYEQKVGEDGEPQFEDGGIDPATGMPLQGPPIADESKPIFSGDFVFERIFGFNLLRHPAAQSMRDPTKPWIIRKMVDTEELRAAYAHDPEKLKYVTESKGDEFVVFDAHKASYSKEKNQALVKEFYYPKCKKYPNGYFYIAVEGGILEQGELPFGIFPVVFNGCDEFQTSPRRRSIIRVARPYQAEINRASSQLAMAQVTIGDDKVLYQSGTKLAQGSLLPGVRGISYQGAAPQILPGRDGSQFLPYIESQIRELERALMIPEIHEEKPAQLDPYTMLQRSIQQQQKFSLYGENFGQFLVDAVTLFLSLARKYLPDNVFIPAVGRHEAINIEEFRTTDDLGFILEVEPMDDTVETKLGKQLTLNHIVQFAGQHLQPEDIARIARAMPFGNNEEAFKPFLLQEDNVKNALLALDRGGMPRLNVTDDNKKFAEAVAHRMGQSDFSMLPPQVQQNYEAYKHQHEQAMAEKAAALQAAKDGMIPVGGAMIGCDMSMPDKEDPSKSRRVRIPYHALDWLVQRLEAQGQGLEKLEHMNQGVMAEVAGMLAQQGQLPQPGMPQQMAS